MIRKVVVRVDQSAQRYVSKILSNNNSLNIIDSNNNVYMFEFDDVEFAHATLLLGKDSQRFGYNLDYYLTCVLKILGHIERDYIVLDFGPDDFKRRASEDLGVGLASLFMVKSFNVRWETIYQIPTNRKLSKLTPDFEASQNGERYIFECKGTTQPNKIEDFLTKALDQVKGYYEPADGKLAIVSYFPKSTRTLPSFMFVADPPQRTDTGWLEKFDKILLHYIRALEYANLSNTSRAIREYLAYKVKVKEKEKAEGYISWREESRLKELESMILKVFEREIQTLEKVDFENLSFIGRWHEIRMRDLSIRVFRGIEEGF